jgi:predicted small metal-binding protein
LYIRNPNTNPSFTVFGRLISTIKLLLEYALLLLSLAKHESRRAALAAENHGMRWIIWILQNIIIMDRGAALAEERHGMTWILQNIMEALNSKKQNIREAAHAEERHGMTWIAIMGITQL